MRANSFLPSWLLGLGCLESTEELPGRLGVGRGHWDFSSSPTPADITATAFITWGPSVLSHGDGICTGSGLDKPLESFLKVCVYVCAYVLFVCMFVNMCVYVCVFLTLAMATLSNMAAGPDDH